MRYYDDYMDLYHMEDDQEYYEYVSRELDKIKRRYDRNESKRIIKRNKYE